MKTLPSSVLFACSQNSVRSPMAEALAKRLYGQSAYVDSVGVRAEEVDAFAAAVLDEIGIDVHRNTATDVEYWPVPDATAVEGSRETRLQAYRQVRDLIMGRLKQRFGVPSGPTL